MKELRMVPSIEAAEFPPDVESECIENEVSTHYADGTAHVDWEDPENMPKLQAWLLETYPEVEALRERLGRHQPSYAAKE